MVDAENAVAFDAISAVAFETGEVMRWFYAPNERTEGDQIGPRLAFERLLGIGQFSAYQAYSYLVRRKELADQREAEREFVDKVVRFQPDVIFIQHIGPQYDIGADFISALKEVKSKPFIVAHEGDAYDQYTKPLSSTQRLLFRAADMCFLVGLGSLREIVQSCGGGSVRLSIHSYDTLRFGTPWEPSRVRTYDAVMIANLAKYKSIPGIYLPGGRKRLLTALEIFKIFGDRMAVFGSGWQGHPFAKGRCDFSSQGSIIRESWVSFNWHHYDKIALYSSDRLQISLASGVPHITNWQPGYEHLYGNVKGLYVVKSPREAADVATMILSMPVERRIELGVAAAEYAKLNFSAEHVYENLVQVVKEQLLHHRS